MKHTLVIRSGISETCTVFVQLHDTLYSEPVEEWIYYPTTCSEKALRDNGYIHGSEPLDYVRPGVYRLAAHGFHGHYPHVELTDGGATKPAHVERSAVEPPKLGRALELRWNHGRWERLFKTKGWVPA